MTLSFYAGVLTGLFVVKPVCNYLAYLAREVKNELLGNVPGEERKAEEQST